VRLKVVVTGGAGFIGSNLIRTLVGESFVDEVIVVDDFSSGVVGNLVDLPIRVFEGTILDSDLLDQAIDGASSVVHLAAVPSVLRSVKNPRASHEANATGTLCVLEAARRHGIPQVILASSSSVYGANPNMPKHEELRPIPLSPYAVSKLAAESYAIAYASCFGLSVLPFRFFNVFGPGQPATHGYAAVVPAFVSAALEGRPLQVFGDGEQTRDFTFVGSVVSVIVDAILRQVSSMDPVNLAFGTRTSLRSLATQLERVVGRTLELSYQPARTGDVRDSQADCTRIRSLFPHVEPYPLRIGLEATVAWMSSRILAGR
jgi:UDP-glucose 4-epimerase